MEVNKDNVGCSLLMKDFDNELCCLDEKGEPLVMKNKDIFFKKSKFYDDGKSMYLHNGLLCFDKDAKKSRITRCGHIYDEKLISDIDANFNKADDNEISMQTINSSKAINSYIDEPKQKDKKNILSDNYVKQNIKQENNEEKKDIKQEVGKNNIFRINK